MAMLLLVLACFSIAQDAPPDRKKGKEEPVKGQTSVSVTIPMVTVNVTALDKSGNLIRGLQKDNFKVFEDGKPQTIEHFFPDESPVNVVLLLESSNLIRGLEYDFWDATQDFVRTLRKGDYCALVTYDIKPSIAVDFTEDFAKLGREASMSLYFKGFSESCLSDAITFVIDRMKSVEGKKAIVLLSTGFDTFSRINYGDALKIASNSDTVIYAISMGQFLRTTRDHLIPDEIKAELMMCDVRLKSFAKASGGEAFFPRFASEYTSILRNVNLYLRYQYTLAYRPENQKADGKTRKIKIEATADINGDGQPDKIRVTHKDSYKPVPRS